MKEATVMDVKTTWTDSDFDSMGWHDSRYLEAAFKLIDANSGDFAGSKYPALIYQNYSLCFKLGNPR